MLIIRHIQTKTCPFLTSQRPKKGLPKSDNIRQKQIFSLFFFQYLNIPSKFAMVYQTIKLMNQVSVCYLSENSNDVCSREVECISFLHTYMKVCFCQHDIFEIYSDGNFLVQSILYILNSNR